MANGTQLLEMRPDREAIRMSGDNVRGWKGQVELINPTNVAVYYKLKMANNMGSEAKPNRGELQPFQKITIALGHTKRVAADSLDFFVMAVYKPLVGVTDAVSVWQLPEMQTQMFWNISETRLRMQFTADRPPDLVELTSQQVTAVKLLQDEWGKRLLEKLVSNNPQWITMGRAKNRPRVWVGDFDIFNCSDVTINWRLKGTSATNAVFDHPEPNYMALFAGKSDKVRLTCRESKGAKTTPGRSAYLYRLEVVIPPQQPPNATHQSTIFLLKHYKAEANIFSLVLAIFFKDEPLSEEELNVPSLNRYTSVGSERP